MLVAKKRQEDVGFAFKLAREYIRLSEWWKVRRRNGIGSFENGIIRIVQSLCFGWYNFEDDIIGRGSEIAKTAGEFRQKIEHEII